MSATVSVKSHAPQWPEIARRYDSLVRTHRQLEDQIGRETARPAVNTFAIQEMKRRKLHTKDAIAAIERLIDGQSGDTDLGANLAGTGRVQ